MSFLRLNPSSDLSDDYGRAQLQETLELAANEMRRLREELDRVKEADEIVRAVPIEAYPIAQGPVQTSAIGGGSVGDILWSSQDSVPGGYLRCDGATLDTTAYADLFAVTGYAWGGAGTNFNAPDLRGRSPLGSGTGSGLTARSLADSPGQEGVGSHSHGLGSHNHTIAHIHTIAHTHKTKTFDVAGTGSSGPGADRRNSATSAQYDYDTGAASTSVSGAASTSSSGNASGNTDSTGSGNNVHPSAVLGAFVRYTTGASGSGQVQSIAWGEIQATWNLSNGANFTNPQVTNTSDSLANTAVQEPNVTAACDNLTGTASTILADNKIRAVVRLPYNFRSWKARAVRVRTKVAQSSWGSGWPVSLKVYDPSSGALLGTRQRTVSSSDSDFVDLTFSSEDMGPNWKAGYPLVVELKFAYLANAQGLSIKVGRLEIGWR